MRKVIVALMLALLVLGVAGQASASDYRPWALEMKK